jgi:CHAD domain-containing protein
MNKKKWQIENLTDKLEFKAAANLILKNRLAQVQEDIKKYFTTDSVEDLHKVRISLRRLRYSMELFISCFDKKKFMILYNKVEALQDLSGKVRDYDVMKENMKLLAGEEKVRINNKLFLKVDELRTGFYNQLKLELMKYLLSKSVKNFEDLLK